MAHISLPAAWLNRSLSPHGRPAFPCLPLVLILTQSFLHNLLCGSSHKELCLPVSHIIYILLATTFSQGECDSVMQAEPPPLAMSQIRIHSESHIHTFFPGSVAQLLASHQLAIVRKSILTACCPLLPSSNPQQGTVREHALYQGPLLCTPF